MVSINKIQLEINKPEGYLPICEKEKKRIIKIVTKEIINLAERFDGYCRIKLEIKIEGKGNA